MSTDLSPAEQARAVQFVAEWLADNGYGSTSITGKDVIWALTVNADPPETVESLRAERDEALAEMEEVGAAWRQEQSMHQKAWATIRNLQAELAAALRDNERFEGERRNDELHKATGGIACLRATHTEAEAARGRCSRED